MKHYIYTDLVMAEKTTIREMMKDERLARLFELSEDADLNLEYYLVQSDGGPVVYTAEGFEAIFREADGMNFGLALEACKMGERIARKGWNGKNMYVFLAHEPDFNTDADLSMYDGLEVEVGDVLAMKTAQETFQLGWLASQADMLADDWYIVE